MIAHQFWLQMLVLQCLVYGAVAFHYHARRATMSPEERKAFDEEAEEESRLW